MKGIMGYEYMTSYIYPGDRGERMISTYLLYDIGGNKERSSRLKKILPFFTNILKGEQMDKLSKDSSEL